MKIFVGNSANSMEFFDFDLILSTSGWSLNDQSEVIAINNKEYVECYINRNKTYLNKDNRFITEKDVLLSFGFTKDALNFEFYFLNLLYQVDLIVLSLNFSENLERKALLHIQSNLRRVKIPSIIINTTKKETTVSYIVPNYKNEFVIKNAIYFTLDFKKSKNYIYSFGKYLSDLKETIHTYDVKVLR